MAASSAGYPSLEAGLALNEGVESSALNDALNDCAVSVAVDLAQGGEGVVIGVFVDGVDLTDEFETVEDYMLEETLSNVDSEYWDVDEQDMEELTDVAEKAAPVETDVNSAKVEESAPQAQPTCSPSPVTKSRRWIIGGIKRSPSTSECAADPRDRAMPRARSVTLIRRKQGGGGGGHAPFLLADSAEAPWAAPWSPQKGGSGQLARAKVGSGQPIVFQGGSGQLARALSASALSLDLGRNSEGPAFSHGALADCLKPPSWDASPSPHSVLTFTSMSKQAPGSRSRKAGKNAFLLPALSPDFNVALTGSKRGDIAGVF